MHMKKNPSEHDDGSSGGGYPIPSNSTTEGLVSLSAIIDFIGSWLQSLKNNVLECCYKYFFAMKTMFHKIPVELSKLTSPN